MKRSRIVDVNNESEDLRYNTSQVIALFSFLDRLEEPSIPPGDLSIAFVSVETIKKIHADFLNDPTATDVITFPGDSALNFAGEICVCMHSAVTFSQQNNIPFGEELARYLVHGWLHLAGYDDVNPSLKAVMLAKENFLLETLKREQKVPDFEFFPDQKIQ